GTPLVVGLDEALSSYGAAWADQVGRRASVYDLFTGSLMPMFLVLVVTVGSEGKQGLRSALSAAPFALTIGAAHASGAALVAHTLGPELPSLIGPAIALAAALAMLRSGVFVPPQVWRLPNDAKAARRSSPCPASPCPASPCPASPSLARALTPYGLLVALLVVTRLPGFGVGQQLRAITIGWTNILDTALSSQVRPLHSPGFLFLVVAALAVPLFRLRASALVDSARTAGA